MTTKNMCVQVFVTLSLYNSVRLIMTLFFPNGISQLAEALVSISRLQVSQRRYFPAARFPGN
jgi:hypothetical protein